MDPNHRLPQVFDAGKERPCLDLKLTVVSREAADLPTIVRILQLRDHRARRKPIRGQPLRIQNYPYFSRLAADDLGFRHIVNLLERIFQLTCDLSESVR